MLHYISFVFIVRGDGRPQYPQATSSSRQGTNRRKNNSTPSSFEPIGRRKNLPVHTGQAYVTRSP